MTHPEIYEVSSAPWYTVILLFGIVSGAIILKVMIREKVKKDESEDDQSEVG